MNLYFYAKPSVKGDEVIEKLKNSLPDWEKIFFTDLAALQDSLRKPLISSKVVLVIFVDQEYEMENLLEFKDTLQRFDSVLLLAEDKDDLRRMSLELSARLVLSQDLPPSFILSALEKITQRALARTHSTWDFYADSDSAPISQAT